MTSVKHSSAFSGVAGIGTALGGSAGPYWGHWAGRLGYLTPCFCENWRHCTCSCRSTRKATRGGLVMGEKLLGLGLLRGSSASLCTSY